MVIFLRELKRNRRAFIIWSVIIIIYAWMQMAAFPSFSEQYGTIEKILSLYPENFAEALGIDKINMTEALGYFAIKGFPIIILMSCIYAILLTAGILSKEENEKTIEFLLAKPVTRNAIVTGKLLCALFYILVLNVLLYVSDFAMLQAFKTGAVDGLSFTLLSLGMLLANLAFASIGFLLSVFVVKIKASYPISIGIILALYFFSLTINASNSASALKYITIFKYVDAADILSNKSIGGIYLALFAIIIAVPVILSYFFYNKKDITV